MRARRAFAMLLLLSASALAGCVDLAVFPAEFSALAPGWAVDGANVQDGTVGAEPIVRAHYHVSAYRDPGRSPTTASLLNPGDEFEGPGLAMVVSVPDAPIVDEQSEIQKRVDAMRADNGIPPPTERTGGTASISGQQVPFKVFDAVVPITGGTAKALVIDVAYKCAGNGQNVRIFGYAATEVTRGATFTNFVTWRELAGEAESGKLGGMVSTVKCS